VTLVTLGCDASDGKKALFMRVVRLANGDCVATLGFAPESLWDSLSQSRANDELEAWGKGSFCIPPVT